MTKQLLSITRKQQYILSLIYTYRFLNSTQLQALLKHKDRRRILTWLKDLREKDYLKWQYDPNDFISKSKPAIYYLSLNGIRYLKSLERYPNTELRKRYKDRQRTSSFIHQSILIADCCITLESSNTENIIYNYVLEADYLDPDSTYHYLNDFKPSLYFTKTIKDKDSNDDIAVQYLLEIFNDSSPRYTIKRKLEIYTELIEEDETNQQIVLLALPNVSELLYAKRRVKLLSDNLDEDTISRIRFATTDKIKQMGVAGEIWEEV